MIRPIPESEVTQLVFHGTTILALRHKEKVIVAGDGQVTLNATIVKHKAKKVRRIYNEKIIVGFAGATADALHLSERLESKLERYNGNLTRAAVELAREWRTDKYLRRLEAMMIAVDENRTFLLSGNGDIIEPDEGVDRHRLRRCDRSGCSHGAGEAFAPRTPGNRRNIHGHCSLSLCLHQYGHHH